MIHIVALSAPPMQIYSSHLTQLGLLMANKSFIKVLPKYLDYADVFLFDFVIELFKNIGMNKYTIKLVESKQLLYGPIYSLEQVELETLKTYIKTHLKTGFIWSFKFPAGLSIFFNW